MADEITPRLAHLDKAFSDARFDQAREILVALDDRERSLLGLELGDETVTRLTRSAARGVRRAKIGRVAVINGIMGSLLDRRFKNGETRRIWLDYLRLFNGALSDLRMGLDGGSADPDIEIFVSGLHKSYWKLVLELDTAWHVLPCAFDWRLDIDRSAEVLAQRLQQWSRGEPVHIVAHSMGGLVARRMIQRFPDLWSALDDPDGHRRGGRLVMLGTPNQGSFAITLTLTGEEKAVRRLALLDRKHGLKATQNTISTFHGPYQMLPSPEVDLRDEHAALFDSATWGTVPHHPDLLDLGRRFQSELAQVDTPDRLIYVAGYDYETPAAVRIDDAGVFSYKTTLDGDGRVPHTLGLLDGVATYWVREVHGKLPESDLVLADIHELLATGEPHALLRNKPLRRALSQPSEWRSGEDLEAEPVDLGPILGSPATRSGASRATDEAKLPSPEEQAIGVALLTGAWLGEAVPMAARRGLGGGARGQAASPTRPPRLKLRVEVIWGDIRYVEGDVYCVGHYAGVLPQRAEKALDGVVSGSWDPEGSDPTTAGAAAPREGVLEALTRNGVLGGQLGEVHFFPWAGLSIERFRNLGLPVSSTPRLDADAEKNPAHFPTAPLVATAGMGHPGTLNGARLRRLARSLSWAVGLLPSVRKVCTVLIGSGDGALPVSEALRGLLLGMSDALSAGILQAGVDVELLRIVELNLDRAHEIYDALQILEHDPDFELEIGRDFDTPRHGRLTDEHCLSMVLSAAARAEVVGAKDGTSQATLRKLLRKSLPYGGRYASEVAEALSRQLRKKQGENIVDEDWDRLSQRLEVRRKEEARREPVPSRLSFIRDDGILRIAAIQTTAVVPERIQPVDKALIDEVTRRLTDPSAAELEEYAPSLNRLLIPRDFRSKIDFDQDLVFEVDRSTADIPFEMLLRDETRSETPHLALRTPVARQLRTSYSPPPTARPTLQRRALVIGDPGDPAKGLDLPGARQEARRAVEILQAKGFEVDARIGVPITDNLGDEPGFRPASRLEVLNLLDRNAYDLLHYCGHGDFDPADPRRAGWVFKDGLLTASELETLDRVPQLVVANACLSSRLSQRLYGVEPAKGDMGLLPTLADEFFRRGVWNYLGTAWEISDSGAILFMETLYENLFSNRSTTSQDPPRAEDEDQDRRLGRALLQARLALWHKRDRFGALWAAYQHYGDPELVLDAR
ncbi:MAG: CHAT domain-containing protein [Acidobacteria bacterium]|nr:CHAT domain-containing protein [Acidobacteriota bacterium]